MNQANSLISPASRRETFMCRSSGFWNCLQTEARWSFKNSDFIEISGIDHPNVLKDFGLMFHTLYVQFYFKQVISFCRIFFSFICCMLAPLWRPYRLNQSTSILICFQHLKKGLSFLPVGELIRLLRRVIVTNFVWNFINPSLPTQLLPTPVKFYLGDGSRMWEM